MHNHNQLPTDAADISDERIAKIERNVGRDVADGRSYISSPYWDLRLTELTALIARLRRTQAELAEAKRKLDRIAPPVRGGLLG